ncbi:DUF2499 domain-containing protein [Heliophilum fasciatum]|uniref:Uncharacterized protein DUF2499 n=1 Tax=Heliophilum fasciatum TaxID=35700 RepID=A0A4R2S7K3_9FIRM|nr:DUF2499 domain-containing protein [Heliophilum fasciatum]MCW2277093.1 hypothetical protein [Heliophilum fasciatum]TCP68381.1 uncharacterized protein DUF2499 [Heliophilum fasciatum]
MLGLLSLPTWIVHIGSIVEWGLAMVLFYRVGQKLNNRMLMLMPWAMVPYLISGFFAIWYHLTLDTLQWLSDAQSYLTLMGSCAFGIWAFFLIRSLPATGVNEAKGGTQTHV